MGCSGDPADSAQPDGGTPASAQPWSGVEASELFALTRTPVELVALPGRRIGILSLTLGSSTDPICPDCEEMQLGDQCPAACKRNTVSYAVHDESGKQLSLSQVLRDYAVPSSNHYIGSVQAARLSDGSLGVAIQLCKGPPSRSCALEYAAFTETGQRMSPTVHLYEDQLPALCEALPRLPDVTARVRQRTRRARCGAVHV